MNWLIYILVFLALIIGLVIFSQVKIRILFLKDYQDDFLEVDMWFLFKLVHINKTIPMVALESVKEGIKFESKTEAEAVNNNPEASQIASEKKDRITPKKIFEWKRQFKRLLAQIHNLHKEAKRFLKHVKIEKYQWESVIGTGEAVNTGVLTGFFWGVKGSLLGIVTTYVKMTIKPVISVKADFNQQLFHTRFECILKFRVGYLMITGIRILFKFFQGGRKIWQENIPSKA